MDSAQICLYHQHSLHRQSSTSKQWLHKDPFVIGIRFSEARGSPLFSIFILFLALFPSSAIYIHNCLPPKPLSASKASSFCLWCMEHGNRRMTSHSWLGQTDSWAYFNTQTHTRLQTHTHQLAIIGEIKIRRWWIYQSSTLSSILFPSLLTEHGTKWSMSSPSITPTYQPHDPPVLNGAFQWIYIHSPHYWYSFHLLTHPVVTL